MTIWLLVLGITGLFLRKLRSSHRLGAIPGGRLILAVPGPFPLDDLGADPPVPLDAPALVKLAVVLIITMGVMLAAYEAIRNVLEL